MPEKENWRLIRRLKRYQREGKRELEAYGERLRRIGVDERWIEADTGSRRLWVKILETAINIQTAMNLAHRAVALDIDMLHLPDDCWDDKTWLSCKGRNTVLALSRKEEKERTDRILRYAPLIAAMVAVVAAAMAVIAIIKRMGR